MLDWKLCFVSIARKMNKKETSTQNNIDFICAGGFFMNNFRTDMAVERNDIYKKQNSISNDIDGVETEKETPQAIEANTAPTMQDIIKEEKQAEKVPVDDFDPMSM